MLSAGPEHAGKHLYRRFLQNKIEVLPTPPFTHKLDLLASPPIPMK